MRTILSLIFTIGLLNASLAQDPTSLFFTSAQPSGSEDLHKIPASFTGVYVSPTDSLKQLYITEDSIFTRITIPVVLSWTELVNNPTLHFRDSLIYGVYPDRGIPVVRINDTVVYCMVDNYLFFKPGAKQTMRKVGDVILLNFKDQDGNWSVLMLKKNEEGGIVIAEIDHEKEMELINRQSGIRKKTIKGTETYFLNMNPEQMITFVTSGGFNVRLNYNRID